MNSSDESKFKLSVCQSLTRKRQPQNVRVIKKES